MDEEERVFENLRRTPLDVVMKEIFDKQLLVYDYQTQTVRVRIGNQLDDICKKHGWDIEDIIDIANEK